jgi:EAL domain-containing protein (putative c-di-GMP-specific phosphodiesterase class I)
MSATPAQSTSATNGAPPAQPHAGAAALALVIDTDMSTRRLLSLVMYGAGVETLELTGSHDLQAALDARRPDLVFLNAGAESSDAVACIDILGLRHFDGHVQLMGSRSTAVLSHVRSIGEQHGLLMLSPLKKPFDSSAVLRILNELKLGDAPPVAGRVDLDEVLRNNWLEFYYQPKIDLRRKQLVGVEASARARHPQKGMLLPGAFLPGATEQSLVALSELALANALRAGQSFSQLGVNLRLATDIPVRALAKLKVAEVVQRELAHFPKWPGLILDVAEDQIVTELGFAAAFAREHRALNVALAIDDFGRAYSTLSAFKGEMPFAEIKLDRTFVADCGSDKSHLPLCKSVIELAHKSGRVAVATGIEKASDALTLVGLGCDCGQGFLLGQPMPEERFVSLLQQRAGARARPTP